MSEEIKLDPELDQILDSTSDISFAQKKFIEYQKSDYDYLVLAKKLGEENYSFGLIPQGTYWDSIDEAIKWCLENEYFLIKVYDLYAKFEYALMRIITSENPSGVIKIK